MSIMDEKNKSSDFYTRVTTDFSSVFRDPSVYIMIAFVVIGLTFYALGAPQIPALADMVPEQISTELAGIPQFLTLTFLIYLITNNRPLPNFEARSPERTRAIQDLVIFGVYYFVAILGLAAIGITYHPPEGFVESENFNANSMVVWMLINFIFYGLIPYAFFRWRGSSNADLGLADNNWALDIWPILAIGGIDAVFAITGSEFLSLTPIQMVQAVPLTLALYGLGAGIPVMIMTQAIVAPRVFKLTKSPIMTVVILTFVYAVFSSTDGGIVFDSSGHAFYVILFWVTHNIGPGLVKAMLTVRTGNSWAHLIAFHVVSNHIWTNAADVAILFGLS